MASIFWGTESLLLIEYIPRGYTINAEVLPYTVQNLKLALEGKHSNFQYLQTKEIAVAPELHGSQSL